MAKKLGKEFRLGIHQHLHMLLKEALRLSFSLACSKQFGFDINGPGERQRHVLTLVPVDWAAEWVRPTPPALKFVGPILSAPGKPLPAELEVHLLLTLSYTPLLMGSCRGTCCSEKHLTLGQPVPLVDVSRAIELSCQALDSAWYG